MKSKRNLWKIATLVATALLMSSVMPEMVAFGVFVQAMGLEILLPLFEVQIILMLGYVFRTQIKPVLTYVHGILTAIDENYFIPSRELVRACPSIIWHAIPGLVSLYWLLIIMM